MQAFFPLNEGLYIQNTGLKPLLSSLGSKRGKKKEVLWPEKRVKDLPFHLSRQVLLTLAIVKGLGRCPGSMLVPKTLSAGRKLLRDD